MASPRRALSRSLVVLASLALVASLGVVTASGAAAALPDDNGLIAFGHDSALWVVAADGSGARPLAVPGEGASFGYDWPAWSANGAKLAVGRFEGGRTDIWTMTATGTGLVNRTATHGRHNLEPTWSPDGSKIAFVGYAESEREADIWVMGADGSGLMNLTGSPLVSESGPAWSPDGARIAFAASPVSGPSILRPDVWVMNADGSGAVNLTSTPAVVDRTPAWSPDGTKIAFQRDRSIWVMRPDGSAAAQLSTPGGDADGDPAWSPDGTRIAFIAFGIGTSDAANSDALAAMDADGANRVTLVTSIPNVPGDGFANTSPSWQPLPGVHHVGLVDPGQGMWHLRDQGTVRSFFYGNPGDVPFLGDWDCDGEDTPGLYRRADGYVYLRNSNTPGIADARFFFGNPGDLPLAGDFDGDGCDTVSLYRPAESRVFVINELGSEDEGLGAADFDYLFGNPGDQPFTGDFDGDGLDSVGLHRATTGLVYFRNSHTQGIADATFVFGDPGDRFVAGDWTGDGIDTAGLFRPADAEFFFRNTNTQGVADGTLFWGERDWLPVAGDFTLTGLSGNAVDVSVFFNVPDPGECDIVAAVTRQVEPPAVLAGAMKRLLEGPTAAERAAGFESWFSPATAGMLNWVTIDAGTARVDFRDFSGIIPNASTSCGSASLLSNLDSTATQFPTVDRAVYSFDGDVAAFYEWLQMSPPPGF